MSSAQRGGVRSLERRSGTQNRDGSTTRSTTSRDGRTRSELTTRTEGRSADVRLTETETRTARRRGQTTTRTVEDSFSAHTDRFGRTETTVARTETVQRGARTTTTAESRNTDRFDNVRTTRTRGTETERGGQTRSESTAVTTDQRGHRETVREQSTRTEHDGRTTTHSETRTEGSSRTTSAQTSLEDGHFSATQGVDTRLRGTRTERTVTHERGEQHEDRGISQEGTDRLRRAQAGLDVLDQAGLNHELTPHREWDTRERMHEGENHFVGAHTGTAGVNEATVGPGGVRARFQREGEAGLYAERRGQTSLGSGTARYEADAHLQASAGVDARATLNTNGLEATARAHVGVEAQARVSGELRTAEGHLAGVPVHASIGGEATVAARAEAEATGAVRITRNPPVAVVEGSVGASAVVRAEGTVRASAGPFSVNATGYASAGAEAVASGHIGYDHGHLRLSGSVGAALGVGLGGNVGVDVDVGAIGQMAGNTARRVADVDGDGHIGMSDARAALQHARASASHAAQTARHWLGF